MARGKVGGASQSSVQDGRAGGGRPIQLMIMRMSSQRTSDAWAKGMDAGREREKC